MQHFDYPRQMWRQFFSIWIPLFLTQLSLVAGGFFAATVAGRHSTVDLAGAAVGVNLWVPVLMTSIGLFMGLTPIISQLLGANQPTNIPSIVRQGIYLSLTVGLVTICMGSFLLPWMLDNLGLEPAVRKVTQGFLTFIAYGIIPCFISVTLRNVVDAHGYTRISLSIMTTGFFLNIILNYVFIDGYGSIPSLGGAGAGLAITISNSVNCLLFFLVMLFLPPFSHYRIFKEWEGLHFARWREQLKIGLPIGGANFLEISLFSIVGLLITSYGTQVIAAHNAANNFSNVLYSLPLSAGIAATILCGFELGAKRFAAALRYARMAQVFTIGVATVLFILAFFNFNSIAGLYTNDPQMITLTASFMVYALMFTFADATGVPIQGALRGYKDVRFVFFVSLLCYWCIGLTLGIFLSHYTNLGPYGYWVGIICGLLAVSIAYNSRLIYLNRNRHKIQTTH